MKAKRDKKILDKEIENQMDREFEKAGIKIRVYHFRDINPFNSVTVVTENPNYNWEHISAFIKHNVNTEGFNPATHLLEKLIAFFDLYGVAICDKRDTFSRQEGRRRAKHRLLKHLKGRD